MGRLLPKFSILLFVLFLVGILDIALYLIFDARGDILRSLPGQSHEVLGKLPESIQNVNALPRERDAEKDAQRIALLNDKVLAYAADAPGISIHFQELRGRVWRGELTVADGTPPGRHTVRVFPKEMLATPPPSEEPSTVKVQVFATPAALRASHMSLAERFLGVGPWWVIMGIIPLAGVLLVVTFRQGGADEARLRARGLAPIYKLARNKDHWELVFGLGSEHGVQEGEHLELRDPNDRLVGMVTALRVKRESSEARLDLDADISPFHLVGKASTPSPSGPRTDA